MTGTGRRRKRRPHFVCVSTVDAFWATQNTLYSAQLRTQKTRASHQDAPKAQTTAIWQANRKKETQTTGRRHQCQTASRAARRCLRFKMPWRGITTRCLRFFQAGATGFCCLRFSLRKQQRTLRSHKHEAFPNADNREAGCPAGSRPTGQPASRIGQQYERAYRSRLSLTIVCSSAGT